MIRIASALFLIALLACPCSALFYADGTFNPADWQLTEVDSDVAACSPSTPPGCNPGDMPSSTGPCGCTIVQQIMSGGFGDGGAFRRIGIILNASTDYAQVTAINLRALSTGDTYNPRSSGALTSIDYFEDAEVLSGTGAGEATGLALRQNNTIYIVAGLDAGDATWTHKVMLGITPGTQGFLQVGAGTPLDFDGSGAEPDATIEFGFFRAISSSPHVGGPVGMATAGIDNWRVVLNKPCTADADCDDGDSCTMDQCISGTCQRTPIAGCGTASTTTTTLPGCTTAADCDDGDRCTEDGCAADHTCTHALGAGCPGIMCEVNRAIALLSGPICGADPVRAKIAAALKKKVTVLGSRACHADKATKAARFEKLVAKARALIPVADALIDARVTKHKLTSSCGTALKGLLANLGAILPTSPGL
jgi:hypothetical protein